MKPIRLLSAAEQVAGHLREEILRGGLARHLPGVHVLADQLAVNHKTVVAAVRLLEEQGLVVPQGKGRSRRIVIPRGTRSPAMRIGILAHDAGDRRVAYLVEMQHELIESGHAVFVAPRYLSNLKMDVRRVAAMVKQNPADAWVAVGATQEVLQWLSRQGQPAFAVFGRRRGVPIAAAGPDKPPAMVAATRELIRLGHRQIVLIARELRRLPSPGAAEQAFLHELEANGVVPGPYHMPDWRDSVDSLIERLDSYFRHAPPTALILDEVPLYLAVQQYLARNGIRVPDDVSLVCTDHSPDFNWCRPAVAQIRWDPGPLRKRVLQWAANVSRGKRDIRQTLTPAEFVPGGSIGPARFQTVESP